MAETVGQVEDGMAFREWVVGWFRERLGYIGRFGPAWERYPTRTAELRTAWNAGMKRGLEKRGCCEERP
jgi:hypothetical protein